MKGKFLKLIIAKIIVFTLVIFICSIHIGCGSDDDSSSEEECSPEDCTAECTEGCPTVNPSFNKVASIINNSPQEDYVMVLAHRGGFIDTPENSISAIEHSTNIGVDIVEIDVQLTSDNVLVVMHDQTIDRTTNGSGSVSSYTLQELKQFKLLMPNGSVTDETIPTLKEALDYSKDKMHLFLDKGDGYLDKIYDDLVETSTLNQTIIGGTLTWFEFNSTYSQIADEINYIPRAGTGQSLDYINSFETGISPIAYFPSCSLISSNNDVFNRIKELNKWILTTSLVGSDCSEETFNPNTIWNWEIQQGTDGIFTDKSEELIEYLTSIGLHNNE
jgi:glycerophosphoryl diester phosphodiesterase